MASGPEESVALAGRPVALLVVCVAGWHARVSHGGRTDNFSAATNNATETQTQNPDWKKLVTIKIEFSNYYNKNWSGFE